MIEISQVHTRLNIQVHPDRIAIPMIKSFRQIARRLLPIEVLSTHAKFKTFSLAKIRFAPLAYDTVAW
jgi:hypothetical protein